MPPTWASYDHCKGSQAIPTPGELIQFRFPIDQTDALGPRSDTSLSITGSLDVPHKPPKIDAFHHAVLSKVTFSPNGSLLLFYYPIVSYTKPPRNYIHNPDGWSADAWLRTQQDRILLRHLPVPAEGWNPHVPSTWGPNPLDFGGWLNERAAWLRPQLKTMVIPPDQRKLSQWKRLDPSVILSPTDLMHLLTYEQEVQAYLFERQTTIAVNPLLLPDYGAVWLDIFAGPAIPRYYPDDDQSSCSSVDPVTMWRSSEAHQDFQDVAKEIDREVNSANVLRWMAGDEFPDEFDGGEDVRDG